MSLVNITHPIDFVDGGKMRAEQWSKAIDSVESAFQSSIHGENFSKESLRGSSFRKRGLTEVFQRKITGSPWVCWPTNNEEFVDVPGGALRFRLRAPASVLVFFSATILRHNKRDVSLTDHSLGGGDTDRNPQAQNVILRAVVRGYWEGGRSEPGDEYVQARTDIHVKSDHDRPNMSRGIFLPWKINPIDGVNQKSLSDVRMFSDQANPLLNTPEPGLLIAGWHNIRHTISLSSLSDSSDEAPVVFGDTELIVLADYGPVRGATLQDRPNENPFRPDLG